MNSDSRVSDPMQKLLGKVKTAGIKLPPNLFTNIHVTSMQKKTTKCKVNVAKLNILKQIMLV
jgi:hypothetical protein